MKKIFTILLGSILFLSLASCSSNVDNITTSTTTTIQEEKDELKYRFYTLEDGVTDLSFLEGYPWLNTSIEGVMGKIKKPSAKDDFFAYANYDMLKDYKLPAGKNKGGGLVFEGAEIADKRIGDILNDSNSSLYKINNLLTNGDKESIKADILATMNYTNEDIKKIFSSKEMFYFGMNQLDIIDAKPGYYLSLSTNPMDNVSLLYEASCGKNMQDVFVEGLLEIIKEEGINIDNPKAFIIDNLNIIQDMYNSLMKYQYEEYLVKVKDLSNDFNGFFDIKAALKELGFKDDDNIIYNVYTLKFVSAFDEYVRSNGYEFVKNLMVLTKLFYYRYYIGSENYLKLYRDKLSKIDSFKDDKIIDTTEAKDLTISVVKSRYPEVLGREYSIRYANNKTRDIISNVIEEVIAEYKLLLSENDWLSDETKAKAIEKLDLMSYITYFEDGYLDISDFKSNKTNIIEISEDYYDYSMTYYPILNVDFIRNMSPFICNAAYFPSYNSFVITHAIVSAFVDNADLTKELIYGSIGNTIGHEISHGFDSSGSDYDKNGEMNNWWTDADKKVFNEKIDKLRKYYDENLSSLADARINGSNIDGEVTADLGGLKVMLRLASKIEGFDYKKFFNAYANSYGFVYTRDKAYQDVLTNPHPISYLRVNVTLAQFDIFNEVYDIHEGDFMYIAKEDRITIW